MNFKPFLKFSKIQYQNI